ncbi:hypothetical protein CTAYLR_009037 [Chrysophaeum taylorii]|uniref:Vesicle transport protein n=1 Tax=Chrysophaeum taylorii TaxID=2483200 RepID=A0AAD7UFB2_9STRA|nr:hypothetical protein CTAYLR_009037 [Chrysophaeum taylorii]
MNSLFGSGEEKKEASTSSATTTSNVLQSYADDLSARTSKLLGLEPKSQLEQLEDEVCACCPTLTYQQRIGGYCFCVFVSFCLTIGAATRLGELLKGDPAPFAIFYTLQNIFAIIASLFLVGPASQCKKMCDKTRYIATLIYFLAIIATLFFAFYEGLPAGARIGLVIAAVFFQWCALLWYTLSYIPYAREYICGCCQECCKDAVCCCGDCEKGNSE